MRTPLLVGIVLAATVPVPATRDDLRGPWRIYEPGTLRLEQASRCSDHVASPDVHVDAARREILMYFHCPAGAPGSVAIEQQKTFFAVSKDGLRFAGDTQPLGPTYFRVFRWKGHYYSRIGDKPERILMSEVRLAGDWHRWRASGPVTVLRPERSYEGSDLPIEVSQPDDAPGRVHQLRDPAIFKEGRRRYLLHSIAGESDLAIAKLDDR